MYIPEFRRYCLLDEQMFDTIDIEDDMLMQLDGDNDQVYMQYIGRKDRNGVKIFHGDILVTSNNDAEYDLWTEDMYGATVVHPTEDLGYEFSDWHIDDYDDESMMSIRFVKVIGNVFENPELLPEKYKNYWI